MTAARNAALRNTAADKIRCHLRWARALRTAKGKAAARRKAHEASEGVAHAVDKLPLAARRFYGLTREPAILSALQGGKL